MISFSLKANGFVELSTLLEAGVNLPKSLIRDKELKKNMAAEIVMRLQETWRNETTPEGEDWPPLELETIARRKRKGLYHEDILYATGTMFDSLRYEETDGPGIKIVVDWPAPEHQDGTFYIPARPMLPEDDTLIPEWLGVSFKKEAAKAAIRKLKFF